MATKWKERKFPELAAVRMIFTGKSFHWILAAHWVEKSAQSTVGG